MKLKNRLVLCIILSLSVLRLTAQDTFFCEAGPTGGCGFVLGDRNGMLFNLVEPLGGGFIKYKFNGHYEVRAQVDAGYLGITKRDNIENYRRSYIGVQALGEFNFFNFGVKRWEAYRTWVSPTIFTGIGAIVFDNRIAATWPMGIGVKFKLSNRINMGLNWTVTKVFNDHLDYMHDPLGINGAFWNNRDWYSTAQIYISVNFVRICAPCHDGRLKI